MNSEYLLFSMVSLFLAIAGLYCILVSRNLIRIIIGIELITKSVTLLLIFSGYITGHTALSQTLVITLIVIEAVIISVAAGITIGVYRHNDTLDARRLRNLKG